MWRGIAVLVVLGACSFQSSVQPSDATSDVPARPVDAAIVIPGDTSAPAVSICNTTDATVIACYPFDGDAKDATSHHLDATATNVSFPAGKVGQAMQSGATSAADIGDSTLFDVTALTIEAWIQPAQLPANGDKAIIIDVDRQYTLFLHADGSLTCGLVNGATMELPDTTAHLTIGQWAHVACTYDGATGAIYVDGIASSASTGGDMLGSNGDTGLSIAADNNPSGSDRSSLIGSIDELRLLKVARTAAQICADAGKPSCP